jgi:hypothetical protein
MNRTARGVFICHGPADGSIAVFSPTIMSDMKAGDAQFLEDDRARPVQLRPLLQYECPQRMLIPSDRVLVWRPRPGDDAMPHYAFVRLPPFQRANTPHNVAKAIRQLAKFDKGLAAEFERVSLAGGAT